MAHLTWPQRHRRRGLIGGLLERAAANRKSFQGDRVESQVFDTTALHPGRAALGPKRPFPPRHSMPGTILVKVPQADITVMSRSAGRTQLGERAQARAAGISISR